MKMHLIKRCYVTCLLEDDDKSVYVGTDKGLYRGVSSSQTGTNMPRVGDAVTVLVKYDSGICYAGTRSKAFYRRAFYRRMKGLHDPYGYCDDQFNDNLLDYHVSVLSLTRYQHKDVVGTDHGVYYSADGSREGKRVEASKNAIVHTLLKSDNTLYAGTNFGLLATNNSGLTSGTPEALTGHPPVFTMLNCTKQDQRHGYIFAGAGRGLFYRVPGKTNKGQTAPNLQCAAIYALLQAQNGDIFISVFNSGIWVSPAPA